MDTQLSNIVSKVPEAVQVFCKSLFTKRREYSYYPILIFKLGKRLPTSWVMAAESNSLAQDPWEPLYVTKPLLGIPDWQPTLFIKIFQLKGSKTRETSLKSF